jgi:autotransporter-associated beta strand protein
MLPLAAGAAVVLGSLTGSALGQTWVGTSGGSFSDTTKWQGGTAPVSGPTTALVFTAGNTGNIQANQNITSPFLVNSLSFNVNNNVNNSTVNGNNVIFPFMVSGNFGYTFQLTGTSPTITSSGLGSVKMVSGADIQLTSDLNINITGPGNLDLYGAITDDSSTSGIVRALTISGTSPVRGWSLVGLSGTNSFQGGLTLDGGAVTATNATTSNFGGAGTTLTVTPNGGMIASQSTLSSSLGTIQLNGPLYITGASVTLAGAFGAPTVLAGSGTLNVNVATSGPVGLTINSDSSEYNGAVVIDQSQLPNMATFTAGALISGAVPSQSVANGSLIGVPSFDVRAGGTLLLDNSVQNSIQNGDRIGDSALVRLRSGNLQLNGPAVGAYNPLDEKVGALSGAGNCTVTVASTTGTTVVTTLEANSLTRIERGTFIFRGTALGDGATAPRGRATLTTPLAASAFVGGGGADGSPNISILPYAAGNANVLDNGISLVTYGADGFRPLTPAEYYSTNLAPADHTANVRLTGATANNLSTTMNALVLANDGGSNDGSVTGTGTLNITSGVIIANPANAAPATPVGVSNNIAFGSAEGIVYTVGTGGLRITGNLTGSNGLTRTGNGTSAAAPNNNNTDVLILTGDNSGLSGPLTINAGILEFNSANALPGTGMIVANGSNVALNFVVGADSPGAVLSYVGSAPLTISRDLAVNTGYLTVKQAEYAGGQPPIGNLTVAGQITGAGGMNYYAQNAASPNGQIFVTNTANTYTGPTRFGAGTTHIAGDGCTGVGGGWDFASSAALTLEGDVTNSRHVNLEGVTTINTNGHNMTLSGPITSLAAGSLSTANGGFIKNGGGTLTLTSPINLLPNFITVNAGSLIVNGNIGPSPTNALTVASAATLGGSGTIWRNTTVNGTLSPGNSPGVLTIGGALTLGSGATMNMQLNGAAAGSGYDQVVVNSAATSGAAVTLGSGTASLSVSLGFAPTASSMFWLINNTNAATTTTGNFAGLAEGAVVPLGSFNGRTYTAHISYNGNFATGQADHSGNDVVLYGVDWTPHCGSADFNCDGDTGTDADIESFFACLAGTCPPPPCTGSADFNGDGDVGTDADIEAFFRVLGGGSC